MSVEWLEGHVTKPCLVQYLIIKKAICTEQGLLGKQSLGMIAKDVE